MFFDPGRLRRRAERLERAGNGPEALVVYRKWLEHRPEDAESWLKLGQLELASGRANEAAQACFRATDVWARTGFLDQALAAATAALNADPGHGPARRLYSILS